MAKAKKEPTVWKFAEAAEAAENLAIEGWDDARIELVAEQFLELRAEHMRLLEKMFGQTR